MQLNTYKNLRKLRELKGYSQEYVASQLGISQRAYSKIETNQAKLDWNRLAEIAKIFELETSDIVDFDEKQLFKNHKPANLEKWLQVLPEKLIEQYEKRIANLESEVNYLRNLHSNV